ncbi:GtrA family protein [Pseudomonas sp. ATCC 13867]|uniref:GtrA family protein n=1 Tax=Pseudomonas sp. ATCC 13867 TaxID=1294143 RepID=UPI0012FE84C2|nr:GtrA family protein [Pseudomonas sp. ATCC 13867]
MLSENKWPGRPAYKSVNHIAARLMEPLRYFLVSLVALLCDIATFSLCIRVFSHSMNAAVVTSFLVGVLVAYFLSVLWVFPTRVLRRSPMLEFLIFMALGVCGACVARGMLYLGTELWSLNPELVKLAAAVVSFILNFLLRKYVLFGGREALATQDGVLHVK